jgi:Icc-related predicted phosphoesterase
MKQLKCMAISDTHGMHDKVVVPADTDILFHSGDWCNAGYPGEAVSFIEWLSAQPARYKVFIAGNHEKCMDTDFFSEGDRDYIKSLINMDHTIHFLEGNVIDIEGRKIWGGPWQPEFGHWAFNLPRGQALKEKWEHIPQGLDVLITHGPPYGVLDYIQPRFARPGEDPHVGCWDLMEKIKEVKPKFHLFGHIHYAAGRKTIDSTEFINASSCDERYSLVNAAHVFYL